VRRKAVAVVARLSPRCEEFQSRELFNAEDAEVRRGKTGKKTKSIGFSSVCSVSSVVKAFEFFLTLVAKGKNLLFSCTLGSIRDADHVFRRNGAPTGLAALTESQKRSWRPQTIAGRRPRFGAKKKSRDLFNAEDAEARGGKTGKKTWFSSVFSVSSEVKAFEFFLTFFVRNHGSIPL
jgi:hypothetical protein